MGPYEHTRIVIIGGGPGGYEAAFHAADLGLSVTIIDSAAYLGGVCLHRGCIPSKALLHIAKILHETKEASHFGIEFNELKINFEKICQWKNDIIIKLAKGLNYLSKQKGINFIEGHAAFIDTKTIRILKNDGTAENLTFDQAIIAVGSKPIKLPNIPNSENILDSTTALDITDIPKQLLIVGGGYIGLELGTIYAELGSKVSVIEMTSELVTGVDRDLMKVLEKKIHALFSKIMLKTKVMSIEESSNKINVTIEEKEGKTSSQLYDKVLIAIGRKPNTVGLRLENAGIKLNEQGFIEVNGRRQTSNPQIYAVGDITGDPLLAHKASHEGRVAVEAIVGKKTVFEPKSIPAVIFTNPEIAWCGLTETRAIQENINVLVTAFSWKGSGRAATLNHADGITKLITDPDTQRILGIGIAGVGAGELIAEGVLAIEMGAVASDLHLTIHPHPTLSETIMDTARLL